MVSEIEGDPFEVVKSGDWVRGDADKGVTEVIRRGSLPWEKGGLGWKTWR